MKEWDGKERRNNPNDHDNIVRLLVVTENIAIAAKATALELIQHRVDDENKFLSIEKKLDKHTVLLSTGTGIFIIVGMVIGWLIEAHK